MAKEKLNDDHLEIIRDLREQGWPFKKIAQELDVTHTTLRRFLRKRGLPTTPLPRRVHFSKDQLEDMVSRYQAGESLVSLKRDYGHDVATIKGVLRSNGVELRTKWNRNARSKAVYSIDLPELTSRYEAGETLEALAAHFRVSSSTVRTRLLSNGVTLRGLGPQPKPERERADTKLRRIYGITIDDFEALMEKQGRVCAICGAAAQHARNHGKQQLCVDHDHHSQRVRGLLCHTCNMGLSYFSDDAELFSRAREYLCHQR